MRNEPVYFLVLGPNTPRETKPISYGSNRRVREERRSMASALVLRSDAQDVQQRSHPGQDPDASSQSGLGRDRYGNCAEPQAPGVTALYPIESSPCCSPCWLPVLNRRQFCGRQKSRSER